LLAGKILRTARPPEVPAGAVLLGAAVAKGTEFNWCQYLLNEFLDELNDTQENVGQFHFTWLIIVITFVGWKEPKDYVGVIADTNDPKGVRYANLWENLNAE
jgi:hypothetical protein